MIELVLLGIYPEPLILLVMYVSSVVGAYIHFKYYIIEELTGVSIRGEAQSMSRNVHLPVVIMSLCGLMGFIAVIGFTIALRGL